MAFCTLIPASASAVLKARRNEWKSTGNVDCGFEMERVARIRRELGARRLPTEIGPRARTGLPLSLILCAFMSITSKKDGRFAAPSDDLEECRR
jgi:hypothetical protein